jgi:ribonuclease E
MLMPSHAKNVKPYKEAQPIFARSGIEAQLDAMFSPQVTLRSGGYLVINQTEALVSIDVNSGRSTREHNIEDTALQTNLEAAEEVARQLRLRDLAGLIVIDFIDMEEKRNNRSVERKLKDALKNDRARIQVGRISHFGLLEMSRQRIRTGVLESTTSVCPTCQGTGHVRAPASVALHVLRQLEDQLLKGVTHHLTIRTRTVVALYILNQKRTHLAELEQRFGLTITVAADETITNGAHFVIERGEPVEPRERPTAQLVTPASVEPTIAEAEPETDMVDEAAEEIADEAAEPHFEEREEREGGGNGEGRRRRRRRGRGRGGERERFEGGGQQPRPQGEFHAEQPREQRDESGATEVGNGYRTDQNGQNGERAFHGELGPDGQPRKRRRGRRGGRRGRRGRGEGGENRPFDPTRQNGDHRPQMDARPPRQDAPAPFEPSGNFVRRDVFDDEIDTTPTLDTRPSFEAPRRIDRPESSPPDEIDTTPQPIERPSELRSEQPPEPEQPRQPQPSVETEDPNRPKRSGWWQRKSFF